MSRWLPMSRWLIAIALLPSVLLSASVAAEENRDAAPFVSPEVVARLILEHDGPQQTFAAQYLRQADHATLLEVQAAIRRLAPVIVAEARARGPDPSIAPPKKGPIDLVNLEVRILEVDAGSKLIRDLGLLGDGDAEDNAPSVHWLDDTQVDVLLRAVEKSELIRQITAPRITTYDGQYANVSLCNRIEYVRDIERVQAGAATRRERPVMDVVQEGLVFGLRSKMSADKRFVTTEIAVTGGVLRKPMRSRSVRCGGRCVEVKVPHLDLSTFRTTIRIPDAGTVLLDNVMSLGKGEAAVRRLALVTTRVTTLDAKELPRPPQKKPAVDERKPTGK